MVREDSRYDARGVVDDPEPLDERPGVNRRDPREMQAATVWTVAWRALGRSMFRWAALASAYSLFLIAVVRPGAEWAGARLGAAVCYGIAALILVLWRRGGE